MEMTEVGPYRLQERLGQGGMGTVHRALDEAGREVAVKVLHPHIAFDGGSRERLEREVSTLARVRHPRVASFLDADVDGPTPYVVTEFVPGLPLDEHVAAHGPLDGDALHRFTAGVHEALRGIHSAGVVHRDLKPGNVMVMPTGEPVIIDFGIAHIGDESRLTATGMVMGTPGYLAPELVIGAEPTVATDWWGLGAVLAFASTGRNPFGGGPNEVVLSRIRRGEHDLRSMDDAWRPLAEACLAVDPAARPTAADVRAVVENGGGELPARKRTQRLAVQTEDDDATQPLQVSSGDAGAAAGGRATQPIERQPTRAIPRKRMSRGEMGFLQPPAQHRDQPAGQVREQEPSAPWPSAHSAQQPVDAHQPPAGQFPPGLRAPVPQHAPQTPSVQQPAAQYVPHQPPHPGGASGAPAWPQGGFPPGGFPQAGAHPAGPVRTPRLHPYDPRTRQPRHPWVVVAGSLWVIALAMVWPVAAGVVVAVWVLLVRWADHAAMSHLHRLFARGRRSGDAWRIALGSPWHLVTALLRGAASLIAPALLGAAAVVLVDLGLGHRPLASFDGTLTGLDNALAWGTAAFVVVLALWWGVDSASLRRGTRLVLEPPLRRTVIEVLVTLVLLAVTAATVVWGLSHGWPTTLSPLGR
ncbi:serine/threonine-protein kinase [Kytococcus sp. Marseille-QA3725]